MVQIDFTRMDDDADLHNKYCARSSDTSPAWSGFESTATLLIEGTASLSKSTRLGARGMQAKATKKCVADITAT
jgi:hypothetical protein